jgi:hypothetical protein
MIVTDQSKIIILAYNFFTSSESYAHLLMLLGFLDIKKLYFIKNTLHINPIYYYWCLIFG